MRKNWIWIILIIFIVAVLGYLGRNQIKSILGLSGQKTSTAISTTPPPKQNQNVPPPNIYSTKTDPAKGKYVVNFAGRTLYTFDKDTKGVSNCYGTCATTWPPYTTGAVVQSMMPANISTIKRTDGTFQFTWKDMPLYYYVNDAKIGDILGDGVGGIWHIIKPQ